MGLLGGGKRPDMSRPDVSRPGLGGPEVSHLPTDRVDCGMPAAEESAADGPEVSRAIAAPSDDSAASTGVARAVAVQADNYAPAPSGFVERVLVTLSGVRQPIVAVLLLIAFFAVLSGKPLDGLLLSIVAIALAWDAGMREREAKARELATGMRAPSANADRLPQRSAWRLRVGRPAPRLIALGLCLAVIYSLIVGSFTLYSWPATFGVAGLGAGVVIIGWGGPTRRRVIPGKFARAGIITWGSLLVVASLWELGALFGQPNFETGSYAHPTISTLTSPLLSSSLGRSVALMGWVALGFFLVER